jgi:hypothetical protein
MHFFRVDTSVDIRSRKPNVLGYEYREVHLGLITAHIAGIQ